MIYHTQECCFTINGSIRRLQQKNLQNNYGMKTTQVTTGSMITDKISITLTLSYFRDVTQQRLVCTNNLHHTTSLKNKAVTTPWQVNVWALSARCKQASKLLKRAWVESRECSSKEDVYNVVEIQHSFYNYNTWQKI